MRRPARPAARGHSNEPMQMTKAAASSPRWSRHQQQRGAARSGEAVVMGCGHAAWAAQLGPRSLDCGALSGG